MNILNRKIHFKSAVKESFDNLPSGVCFFSESGLVTLCNHQMTRLIFALTGRDLQSFQELREMLDTPETVKGAIRDGSCFFLPDGTAWSFSLKKIIDADGRVYNEAIASNVTELREKQALLTEANKAKRQTVAALEQIQRNVVAITREEEILSMKMKLHNEFGYNLQAIRRFFTHDCPAEEKAEFIARQKHVLQKMKGELGNDDVIDPIAELKQLAAALDMEIVITGTPPLQEKARELLAFTVRESLTNTTCHAHGERVFVQLSGVETGTLTACVTNTGKRPEREIIEGGGLTSLRTRIENAGGTMTVHSLPKFVLTVTIPAKGDEPA